ncbi:MAG: glycoside hydrolase family 2 TIM barrel-domain containing protein, partial [Bacillota bacterium]
YDNGCFNLTPRLNKEKENLSFRAVISSFGQEIAAKTIAAGSGKSLKLELTDPHAWNLEDPFLYDLSLELLEKGKIIDRVKSYAGLRKFHIENNKFFLNNEQIFLRLVLDQGFYPDGIWTAPDDQELKADIERAQKVGFNGARLHQKVFAERYHYWADKLGYLTWGEFSDWGLDLQKLAAIHNHRREWGEVVVRDRNHPSIVAWTPFNETANYGARKYRESYTQAVEDIYTLTKDLDPTRPINDASGYIHVETDIYTVHDYDQNPDSFAERYAQVDPENPEKAFVNFPDNDAPYQGEPYVVDEYGGTYWTKEYAEKPTRGGNREEWGYGKSEQEVLDRIEKLTLPLLDNPEIAGYTYTQLTDVEQEVNGIYTYDRKLKFSLDRLQEIFGREEV